MRAKSGNAALNVIVALVVLGAAAYFAWQSLVVDVVVTPVISGTATEAVPGSVIVAAERGLESLKVEGGGRVEWCDPLTVPHAFKAGEVLLRLDTRDVDRAFAEIERTYQAEKRRFEIQKQSDTREELARRKVDETVRLQKEGRASGEDVKTAERELTNVRTTLQLEEFNRKKADDDFEQQKKNHAIAIEKMRVVAPSDGVIEAVYAAPGAWVQPGATVATFYGNKRLVMAKVSEEEIEKVKIGDTARVKLLSYRDTFEGATVAKILPFADAETRKYTVFLDMPESAPLDVLRPEATGETTITADEHHDVPLVPRRALFNGNFLYVVKNGRAELRQVDVGYKALNKAEVMKGIAPGDLVVVENIDQLADGRRVRVLKTEKM